MLAASVDDDYSPSGVARQGRGAAGVLDWEPLVYAWSGSYEWYVVVTG